ncbi:hypothetical protein BD626DRAFT_479679 [Schizophyllum amplum]|uniref:Uncharacterized protein n=1 Tax=Schizophyllum amplum TaxID=97359 RepID=A0A550CSH6_9AGAR|nr:hypothetical protein BD626DRAFT_479679 [Auriculariopsis ampla]
MIAEITQSYGYRPRPHPTAILLDPMHLPAYVIPQPTVSSRRQALRAPSRAAKAYLPPIPPSPSQCAAR